MHTFLRSLPRLRGLLLPALLGAVVASAACGDPNGFFDATIENRVDTLTLGALRTSPVSVPSGYDFANRVRVRTDQNASFDFVFDFDDEGRPVFKPIGILGLGGNSGNPGFLASEATFDAIVRAEVNAPYVADSARVLAVGGRYIGRSRASSCSGRASLYAKFEVLAIDTEARTVTFRTMVNANCGFRDLVPGIPED